MHKGIATAVLAAAFVMLLAAPALAAKDPFKPLVTSDTATTTEPGSTAPNPAPAVIGVNPNPISETMPTTGSDVSSWLVLAYVLVVAGGVALVVARTRHPARW